MFTRFGTKLLLVGLDKFDQKNNTITTYRSKPLSIFKESISGGNSNFEDTGILIQGQLIPNVTLGICKRYKSLYPSSKIVFSSWNDSDHRDIRSIARLGVDVLLNKKPKSPGPSNINLQIVSTKQGVDYLAKKRVKRVLKNRSDAMLTSDYFLEYFQFLFDNYSNYGKRILIPGFNSFLFRLYSPTDQIQFASIDAIQQFWNCPEVENARIDFRFAESYLVREYLSTIGRECKFTIEDSLCVYRDYFVIADNAELGLVLNKGTRSEVSNRWANDGFPQAYSEIHFWNWLELQSNLARYVKHYNDLAVKPNF